jgi:hypothetical protein
VSDAALIAIAARGPGQVGVSYLGNTDGGPLVDGWLSLTADALAPGALWWAASLNDPSQPLIDTRDSTTFGDRLFFATDTFSPGGEPYAAFHCAKTAACPGQRIGVIGWLSEPRRGHRVVKHRKHRRHRPLHRRHR